VLHTYPYRETSLIVEALTAEFGRVAMVARGAKRPRSELRGLLQAFQPLLLSWSGTNELKTLLKAEWRGGLPRVGGSALLCGFYLNELLLKLLPREDPHPRLFATYEAALTEPTGSERHGAAMFRFELLAELGYDDAAQRCRHRRRSIRRAPASVFDRGPRRIVGYIAAEPGRLCPWWAVTPIALAEREFKDAETATGEAIDALGARSSSRAAWRREQAPGAGFAGTGRRRRARLSSASISTTSRRCARRGARTSRIPSGRRSKLIWVLTESPCICARTADISRTMCAVARAAYLPTQMAAIEMTASRAGSPEMAMSRLKAGTKSPPKAGSTWRGSSRR
jgi:DNA repair protein RecO (recombination protein O)